MNTQTEINEEAEIARIEAEYPELSDADFLNASPSGSGSYTEDFAASCEGILESKSA